MNENVAFLHSFKFLKFLCLTIFAFTLLSASGVAAINLGTFNFNVTNMTNYSSTQGYHFNVTVTNSTPISYIWMEHNFSGTLANYTATGNVSSVYYYNNATSLAAGFYYIKWYGNDTSASLNNTDWVHYYQINKSSPMLSITLNGTAGDRSYLNNSIVDIGNSTTPSYINSSVQFYLNGASISSPKAFNTNQYAAMAYTVMMNFSGNQNYTTGNVSVVLTLNDSRIIFGNFSGNVTSMSNYSSTQGYQFSVTAFNSSQYSAVWLRANFSGAFANYTATNYGVTQFNYTAGTLAAGTYTYTWWANNSLLAYFNSSNQTFQVNRSSPVLSVTLNGTAGDRSYFNNTKVNVGNSTTPGYINSSLSFYYDGTSIASPQSWDVSSLPARAYTILMNFSGNQNYTAGNVSVVMTLNDSRIIFGNYSSNVSTYINYSSTQGYQFSVTAFNSSQYSAVWLRANFSGAFANYTATNYGVTQFNYTAGTLAAGTYTYTWWANNSLLAYFNSSNQTFQVNQSYLPITLYINGTNDDSTAYNYSVANITANFSSSFSFNITLWTNLTGSWTLLDNEPSPITNNTDLTPYQAANYLVIANWTGNANYTISSASHYLTLAYYIEPPTPPAGGTGGWSAPSGPSQGGQQSVTFMTIEAGVASIAKYTDKLLDVREINITVSNPANAVKITVSKVDEQPAFITHSITGTVYKYFNITTQNLDESNVAKARLKFRVNKTWYSENNLNPATTKLNRYESNGWRTLSTTQTTSDTDYYYFEAETPGFSTFAVTATKTAQPAPTTCTNTCQPGQSQRAYPDCTCYTPAQPSGGGITPTAPNYDWLIFIMVVVIVTLVLVSMVKKHVKRTHKHHK